MNKERIQWALIAVLFLSLAGLGYMLYVQNSRIKDLSSSPTGERTETPAKETGGYETVAVKDFEWGAESVSFTQLCKGEVKSGFALGDRSRPVSYCLGENRFEVKVGDDASVVLLDEKVTDPRYSPILFGAELVPGNAEGTVLVSYTPEACTTAGDCGVGMPTNFVNYVCRLSDPSAGLKNLIKYPTTGVPVWNSVGTKALFVSDTCGGAGCVVTTLDVFDLAMDSVAQVTTDKAVAVKGGGSAKDVSGQTLPLWSDFGWKSDTEFFAKIAGPDGTEKSLSGQVR